MGSLLINTINEDEKIKIPSERLNESILFYCDSLDIPKHIAFNIATIETGYRGPLDSTYTQSHVSSGGALGPMQIVHRYSHHYLGRKVTKKELRDSIELNVKISLLILKDNFIKYGSWKKATGAYNTGKPVVNGYSLKATNPEFYKRKWIKL